MFGKKAKKEVVEEPEIIIPEQPAPVEVPQVPEPQPEPEPTPEPVAAPKVEPKKQMQIIDGSFDVSTGIYRYTIISNAPIGNVGQVEDL